MTQTSKRNILLVTLLLAIVTIPLKNNWNSIAIVLFCCSTAIQLPLKQRIEKLRKDHLWKVGALFFLWMAATWFWDSSGGFSIKHLEPAACFLFLPMALSLMPKLSSKQVMIACYAFIMAIIAVCLLCLAKSFIEYRQTHDYRVFFYHYLGYQMGLNAIYLSNYCIACITWLLYSRFIHKGEDIVKPGLFITLLACSFLFGMMFLLSSKMSLGLLILLILFMALYIGYKKQALLKALGLFALCIATAWILAQNLGYLKWRIASTEWKTYSGAADNNNGLSLRRTTWTSALELIKEKPLLGYGLRGANEALVEKYKEKKFEMGIPEKYNAHNQFLETTLKSGLIGLALLLLVIGIPFIGAIRQGKFLLTMMIIHFLLVSMVEGTLEIQQEFIFYLFFIFFFHYHYPRDFKNAA
ncbi:MAG: O-antigen ligase family protein [Flavitalea sp.]